MKPLDLEKKPKKSDFSFRRFLILLVMVLGGLYFFLFYLPRLTEFIFSLTIGAFALYSSVVALRRGYVTINTRANIVTYTRDSNPVEFWFYVVFFIIMGILICCFAVCWLPGKFNIFWNFLKI
jgi:hypothetical protein